MAYTPWQIFLVVLLVVTGSLNTLTTKWADQIEAPSSDGKIRVFNHPFSQALLMFIGEATCMIAFKVLFYWFRKQPGDKVNTHPLTAGNRNFSIWIFFVPAMFDMIATCVMYVGLNLTYASSFQMLRGALIAFVAILSILLLRSKVTKVEWLGIFVIILGLVVVGIADFINGDTTASVENVIIGDVLIILAQVSAALQMVAEQYWVNGQNVPPLQAVGWEGLWGILVLGLLHIPMYFIEVPPPFSDNPRGVIEDLPDALAQIGNENLLLVPLLGTVVSISFFNFAGISVTKELSAATRAVLDSVRTLFIWAASLGLGWQQFAYIQVIGFILLMLGMCIYNDIYVNDLAVKLYRRCRGLPPLPPAADTSSPEDPAATKL